MNHMRQYRTQKFISQNFWSHKFFFFVFPQINTALRIVAVLNSRRSDRELAEIVAALKQEPYINIFITTIAMNKCQIMLQSCNYNYHQMSLLNFSYSPMMGYQVDLYT